MDDLTQAEAAALYGFSSSWVSKWFNRLERLADEPFEEVVYDKPLWDGLPEDTRVVFCADHGELLGEDGMWGHPGEMRPELPHVPFGTRNAPELGEVVSLIDVSTILTGTEHGEGTLDRDVVFAAYGHRKAAMNAQHIATDEGAFRLSDGEEVSDPSLEGKLDRFDPEYVVKEDALQEDLEDLGYA